MLVQISSGTGPIECCIAVAKVYEALVREYTHPETCASIPAIEDGGDSRFPVVSFKTARPKFGCKLPAYKSILFETSYDLGPLSNKSICWICRSPVRKDQKRKNWYVDVSIIPEADEVPFNSKDLRVEYFHSGGKGGQNVNKLETGVRLRHVPSGIVTESVKERTQYANLKDAHKKMLAIFLAMKEQVQSDQRDCAWMRHNTLLRGNPALTFVGMECRKAE